MKIINSSIPFIKSKQKKRNKSPNANNTLEKQSKLFHSCFNRWNRKFDTAAKIKKSKSSVKPPLDKHCILE